MIKDWQLCKAIPIVAQSQRLIKHTTCVSATHSGNLLSLLYTITVFTKYKVIQKDGLNFVRLYFLNYTRYVWMIYITFEVGGPKFSNTTTRALA